MSSNIKTDCCADGHEGPALKLGEALSRILAEVQPVAGVETLAVRSALGRVLSDDVVSRINVPSHTNSAMDGYALRGADLPADGESGDRHVRGREAFCRESGNRAVRTHFDRCANARGSGHGRYAGKRQARG